MADKRAFPCFFCEQTFVNETPRNLHLYSKHFGGFNCDRCAHTAGRRNTLRKHYKRWHKTDLDRTTDYAAMPKAERDAHKLQALQKKSYPTWVILLGKKTFIRLLYNFGIFRVLYDYINLPAGHIK
jgi:hypothetical protein